MDDQTVEAWTPGPWRVVIYDAGDDDVLSGMPSVVASDELDCGIVHYNGFVQRHWRSARGDREIHANARLIAAAPDLYYALRLCVQRIQRPELSPDANYVLERAAAALSAATVSHTKEGG